MAYFPMTCHFDHQHRLEVDMEKFKTTGEKVYVKVEVEGGNQAGKNYLMNG